MKNKFFLTIFKYITSFIKQLKKIFTLKKLSSKNESVINENSFFDSSFYHLLENEKELKHARQESFKQGFEKRRQSALIEYKKSIESGEIAGITWSKNGRRWPGVVLSLAIDPYFSPAILAVGSLEYNYKRKKEAMDLFKLLINIEPDCNSYFDLINRAGNFLINSNDYENAQIFYNLAVKKYPNIAMFHNGLSYCMGRSGRFDEAIKHAKKAISISPNNCDYVNDLGYWLMEDKNFKEAEKIFKEAIEKFPYSSKRVKNNLNILYSKLMPDAEMKANNNFNNR